MTGSSGDGPEFVHNLPDPPLPNDPPIDIQATLTATNDYLQQRIDAVNASLQVLANDFGPNGQAGLRITHVTETSLGSQVSISADGRSLIYTPAPVLAQYSWNYGGLYGGDDSFFYDVVDEEGNVSSAQVKIDLITPMRGPQIDYVTVLEDQSAVQIFVLSNDIEFAGGTIVDVTQPEQGSVTIADDGRSLYYTPGPGHRGYDHFNYTVEDAEGHTATSGVSVLVNARFDARFDHYSVDVDAPQVALRVLENDVRRQPFETPRIVAVEPLEFGGTVTIADDGQTLFFQPSAGFVGLLSFTYTVRYGSAEQHVSTSRVYMTVVDPYLAVDNWFMVDPDSSGNTLDVLANDPTTLVGNNLIAGPRNLTITSTSAGTAGGQITLSADGKKLVYTPAAGFSGDETFTYTVVDQTGHADSASVTVHVATPTADPFNLPRFRHPAELEQFLLDQAVANYLNEFGAQSRSFVPMEVPNEGGGGSGGGGNAGAGSVFHGSVLVYSTNGTVSADYSQTNVQHAGIDEADVVETDGNYIYTLAAGRLSIVDVRDLEHPRLVSVTKFSDQFTEMYLQGDRLTLISRGEYSEHAVVAVVDVGDREEPRLEERTEIDGQIVDSRAIGDRVHLVTQGYIHHPAPESHVIAEIPAADGSGTWQIRAVESLDEYVDRVRGQMAELSLPMFRTYNAAGELIASGLLSDDTQIHKPVSDADRSLVSVVTIDVGDETAGPITSTGLFTDSAQQIYVSSSAVYVLRVNGHSSQTAIAKFAFQDDGTTVLEAVGQVRGTTLNQFSLDEHDGRLRIVTNEIVRQDWWNVVLQRHNHLFVLEQHGTKLEVIGSIENLAPTEDVKSVRFVGERAYVVTFRVVDPLFAIDLTDPTDPRVAGALKIPGFSNYLHPIGENYVLGFGRDANEITGALGAAQVSLFYVGDLDHPQLVDRMTLEGADWISSEAFFDHHAIAYFAEHQVLSIPISWQTSASEDTDGDGIADHWSTFERHSAAFVFQLDLDGASGSIEYAGRVEHDTNVRRSVRIGDALVTISDGTVNIHRLDDPGHEISKVHIGTLPRDDAFTIDEDSGPNEFDVRTNDRPGEGGSPLPIVAVTQPVKMQGYYWLGGPEPAGTVTISDDGLSVVFTPAENFFGAATFTYTVFDEVRGEQTATVTVTVENVADAPEAVDDEFTVEVGAQAITLNVLANDVDFDAPQDSYFAYWPVFNATIRLGGIVAIDAGLTLGSLPPQISSTAMVDSVDTLRDSYFWPGLLPYGLTISAVGTTDHGGIVEIDASGMALTYTPADGFEGVETFTYTITTSDGLTDTATVAVRVGEVSNAVWASFQAKFAAAAESAAPQASAMDRALQAIDLDPFSRIAPHASRSFGSSAVRSPYIAAQLTASLNLTLARSARLTDTAYESPNQDESPPVEGDCDFSVSPCGDELDAVFAELSHGL